MWCRCDVFAALLPGKGWVDMFYGGCSHDPQMHIRMIRIVDLRGQDFMEYEESADARRVHPAGRPKLKRDWIDELKNLITQRDANAPPVVLLGFSAGAYMTMRAAMELCNEGFPET